MAAFFTKPLSQLTSKWRIFYEESVDLNPRSERTDFEELRGTGDTRIYRHGQDTLAVSTDSRQIYNRLSHTLGLRPKNGSVLLFPDALLDTVAEAIRARYKRQYTPEQIEAIKQRTENSRFKPGRGSNKSSLKTTQTDSLEITA